MAVKRIVKFVLRLLVVVLLLVGVYFGIKYINDKNNSATDIIVASANKKITQNVAESYDGLLGKVQTNTPQYVRVKNCNDINDFLIEYYNYYASLSCFENGSKDNSARKSVMSTIDKLSSQIETTKYNLNLAKADGLLPLELQRRVESTANAYFEQTKTFLKLADQLKDYVYKVNYNTQNSGIVYEAQLQMVKDYAQTVFDLAIYGHYADDSSQQSYNLLVNAEQSNFSKVMQKFNARASKNTNGNIEVSFADYYMDISSSVLTEFYSKATNSDKANYISSLAGESAEAITVHRYLLATYDYIMQTAF